MGEYGLNWKLELPAIRSRLLLGIGAFSDEAHAFLYWRLNKWSQYDRSPVAGAGGVGPLNASGVTKTMEVNGWADAACKKARETQPAEFSCQFQRFLRVVVGKLDGEDGMGEVILPGPAGALSTIHFENIRDGLEDHLLLSMLRQLVADAKSRGTPCTGEEKLLSAPAALWGGFDPNPDPTSINWSEDPSLLRGHREKVARAVEALSKATRSDDAWPKSTTA